MHINTEQLESLKQKAKWVWCETLRIHARAPETRVASSLSVVEIFTSLFYGELVKFKADEPYWEGRDRVIISKGHGSICMYPILADLGYFSKAELEKVCQPGTFLGGIPDPIIPGYETVNGSLGHGLGVGAGMALGLKTKSSKSDVWVVVGDGELNEGSNWEAIMFSAQHKLDNLVLIIDNNKTSMLDHSEKIISLAPFDDKFKAFGWDVLNSDGHDLEQLIPVLNQAKTARSGKPTVVICETIKGRGTSIENHYLSHILGIKAEEISSLTNDHD